MPNKNYRNNIMHKLQNNEVIFLGRLLFIYYFYYLQMQNGLHALFCELESSWEPTKFSMKTDPPDSLAHLPSFGVILQQHATTNETASIFSTISGFVTVSSFL
jgi:hypothetical protein